MDYEIEARDNAIKGDDYEKEQEPDDYEIRKQEVEIVFGEFVIENTVQPVETLSEKIWWVEKWLKESREVGIRGGNPVGSSYIDARCGTGFGQPDQLAYINFDHEVARKVPDIAGKYTNDVEVYLEELKKEKDNE